MIATLLSLAGINVNVTYEICSWQSGQKNTSWIGPGGGEHRYIYIYFFYKCIESTIQLKVNIEFIYSYYQTNFQTRHRIP